MDHLRHAPEPHCATGDTTVPPIWGGPVPARFEHVRVVYPEGGDTVFDAPAPADLSVGTTTRFRAYRTEPEQTEPALSYQVVPSGPPRVAEPPDHSPDDDPLSLRHMYIGRITVTLPNGERRTLEVTAGHVDPCRLDLTKGLDVKCWVDFRELMLPVGPMLNIDVNPAGP